MCNRARKVWIMSESDSGYRFQKSGVCVFCIPWGRVTEKCAFRLRIQDQKKRIFIPLRMNAYTDYKTQSLFSAWLFGMLVCYPLACCWTYINDDTSILWEKDEKVIYQIGVGVHV